MPITISQLEAKARINRDQWDADKAAIRADLTALNRDLDAFSRRMSSATTPTTSARTGGQASAAPIIATVDAGTVQNIGQAEVAVRRLTAAQREAQDPVLAQARTIRTLQSDIRAYTLALGDADPRTTALVNRLTELKGAQQNSGNQTVTFTQQLGRLIQTLEAGGGSTGGFARGLLQSVGGISLIAGGAAAAGAAVAKLAEAIGGLITEGIGGNAAMEQYATSFKVLLGSADAATARLKELTQFANVTPFNLPEIVEADRVLQTFGGNVLATGKNLTLVGDIASGTNRTFGEVAMWVGRAYDALQSGRPWGEAAQRLQEMGALSGDARARLENLQASGASGTQIWSAFTGEMARFNGMMVEQSHIAAGLASTWGDMVSGALRTATKPAFDAAKQSLEGLTSPDMQHNLEATAEGIAKLFDAIGSGGSAIGAFTKGLGQLPVISQALQAVGFVFQMEGKGLDVVGQGFHYFGEGWNQMMAEITGGTPAVTAATDQIVQHFSDAELAADRTVNELQVVWLDAANGAEQAAQRVAHAWDVGLVDSLKDLKTTVEGAFPDVNGTITQIMTLTDQTLQRAQGRMNSYGDTQTKIQEAYAAELSEGLRVLSDWQTGNLDACSEAASKWGSTAPEIIQHIRDIENELANYTGALNAAKLSADQLRTAQTAMRGGEGGPVDTRGTDASIPRAPGWPKLDQTIGNNNQVATDTAQAQTQAAINRLKATNKTYIEAQVEQEKSQQAAQDALDRARVAAGLIDVTQTAEYKRTHEAVISGVDFVKSQVQGAYDTLRAGISAVQQLSSLTIPSNLDDKMRQFSRLADRIIQGVQDVARRFSKDEITQLYSFSQAAHEAMGFFGEGVTALGDLSKVKVPDTGKIDTVVADANRIVDKLAAVAVRYKAETLAQLSMYAQTGQDAAQLVTAGTQALDALRTAPRATTAAMDAFVTQFADLTDRLKPLSTRYAPEVQQVMADFGERMDKALSGPRTAVDLLKSLPGMSAGLDGYISPFFDNLTQLLDAFHTRAQGWENSIDDESAALSARIKDVIDGISGAVSLFAGLNSNRTDVEGQINLFFDNLSHTIRLFSAYSAQWKTQASDQVAAVATNIGIVMDGINKALDPLTKMKDAFDVGDYEIDLTFQNIAHALQRFSDFANGPIFQGQSLVRMQQASVSLGSVFGGIKQMVDTLTSLTNLADPTGTVDLGYSLDSFFGEQLDGYASAWEAAMTRIGNASENAGKRVGGAFGVPTVPAGNARAGGGGGGDTFNFNYNGQSVGAGDPVIEDLVRKIFEHLNLVQGGVPVGVR